MDKLRRILEDMIAELNEIVNVEAADVELAAVQAEREIRQALERVRRLKDGETLTYEPTEKEEPKI